MLPVPFIHFLEAPSKSTSHFNVLGFSHQPVSPPLSRRPAADAAESSKELSSLPDPRGLGGLGYRNPKSEIKSSQDHYKGFFH